MTLSSIFSVSAFDFVKSEATIVFRGKFYVFYQLGIARHRLESRSRLTFMGVGR